MRSTRPLWGWDWGSSVWAKGSSPCGEELTQKLKQISSSEKPFYGQLEYLWYERYEAAIVGAKGRSI